VQKHQHQNEQRAKKNGIESHAENAGHDVAEQTGTEPFSTHILAARSDLDIVKLKHIRNQYWNAFKHATTHKGEPRDDAVLPNSFSDEQNDGALFTGWHDYAQVAGRLPISAQVFLGLHIGKNAPPTFP
jgi:hypothetical protein